MSRIQIALDVTDLRAAVDFYSGLFAASPSKVRDGYANFTLDDPPLKLVLIEQGDRGGRGGTLNHLGIEVESEAEVSRVKERIDTAGIDTTEQSRVECCYALQEKFWATDPDGAPWEIYKVIGEAETLASRAPEKSLRADEEIPLRAGKCC